MNIRSVRHLAGVATLSEPAMAPMLRPLAAVDKGQGEIERPPEFTWHDYAILLMSIAAEIEHALMIQYLYAAYSLGGPGVPAAHHSKVLEWQRIILGVAKEEMGHLITVQNVIRVLGGPVHLEREDYPWDSGFYPYPFSLEPVSLKTVAKFIVAESPAAWPDDISEAERDAIEALARQDVGHQVERVGALYATMIAILDNTKWIPDFLFRSETYALQASWDEWGGGYAAGERGATPTTAPDVLVTRAAARTQAVNALKGIAQQGEAVQFILPDSEASHFRRFLQVYRGLGSVAGWSAVIPLPSNPVVPGLGTKPGGTVIRNPEAAAWGALFNLRYRMLLSWLAHSFQLADHAGQHASPGLRGIVLNRTFGEMYNLRSIAGLMVRLPLDNDPARPAGPPFQLPYSLQFPPMETDFWRLHLDLLDASHGLLCDMERGTGAKSCPYARALAKSDAKAVHEVRSVLGEGRKG